MAIKSEDDGIVPVGLGSRGVLKSFQDVFITSPGGAICCVWLSCSFKAVVKTRVNLSQ